MENRGTYRIVRHSLRLTSQQVQIPERNYHIAAWPVPSILMLRQQGADLLVRCSATTGQSEYLTIPGHRSGILIIAVAANQELSLDLGTVYQDNPVCYCAVDRYETEASSNDWHIATAMQAAEQQFALGNRVAIQHAAEHLDAVGNLTANVPLLADAALFMSALIAYQRFKFTQAEKLLAKLSDLWLTEPDLLAATRWAKGALALERYETAESLAQLQLALSTIEAHKQESPWLVIDEIEIRLFTALVLMRLGRSTEGVQQLEQGLKLAKTMNSSVLEGKIRNNYSGYYEMYTGEPAVKFPEHLQKSISELNRALDLLTLAGETTTRVSTLGNLARMAVITGNLGKAQAYYQQAIALNNTCHNEVLSGYQYAQLGRLYLMLGDYQRALKFGEQAFQARRSAGAELIAARDCTTLSEIHRELGDISNAIKFGEQAANYLVKHGTTNDQAQALVTLAFALTLAGDSAGASSASDQALALATQVSFPWLLVDIHLARAQALSLSSEDRASEQFGVAVKHALGVGLVPNVIPTLLAASRFHRHRDPSLSNSLIIDTMGIVESTRGQLEAARIGPYFANRNHKVYVHGALLALDKYQSDSDKNHLIEAICRLERGMTYSLLAERHAAVPENPEIAAIKQELNILTHKRISGESDPELMRRYDECIEALNARGFGTRVPVEFDQKSLARIQAQLDDTTAILYYILDDPEKYLIRIRSNELALFTLPTASFGKEIFDELAAIRSPASSGAPLVQLSRILLPKGVIEVNQFKKLLVVAHGILEQVPFSALSLPSDATHTTIGSLCSIQLLRSLVSIERTSRKIVPHKHQAAVLADPSFHTQQNRVAGFRNWTASLGRLPWTAEEARHIKTIFGNEETLVFLGEQANRHNLFQENVKNARILHIATHGYFSEATEDVVGIALSQLSENEPGLVALTDLLGEKFKNRLVVISGCETALGQNLQGEGALSIGRAFIACGASLVISTLWPVSDRASAEFMKAFYSAISKNGGNAAEALRTAQIALQQSDRFYHPVNWAPYLLHSTLLDPGINE